MYDYDTTTLEAVCDQMTRAAEFEFYRDRFETAGVDPSAIDSWEEFRAVPFTTAEELQDDVEETPPEGTVYDAAAMLSFTPVGDDLAPVFDTEADIERLAAVNADAFNSAGIGPGDRVLNTFGYHTFGTGYVLHRGLEELGAEVIPAGPGDSEAAAETIERFDVDALVGNPSYALKIGERGASVDVFVGAGEPFTSIPGLREEVKAGLDADVAVDYFGTRRVLPAAVECRDEAGLHVATNNAIVEIIDPDTDEVLPAGERGELVVTHVAKEGSPFVRYRTGDLAELSTEACPTCGATATLPEGVIGRTDERVKVKGVKVYPESLGTVLAAFDGLTGAYRLEVSRPESTDRLRLVCEGKADVRRLREAVADRLLITPDEVDLVEDLEAGAIVVDERF